MIDVVFLLLVFFMLAARFGFEGAVSLSAGGTGPAYDGPPRLVDVGPSDIRLNGLLVEPEALADRLRDLMEKDADVVVLRVEDGADVQRLIDVMDGLRRAGIGTMALVE